MVDHQVISQLLQEYFVIKGKVIINDQAEVSVINVPGVSPPVSVLLKKTLDMGVLPVIFDRVEGDFVAAERNVKTLKGFPRFIKGNLFTNLNNHLRQLYDCQIDHVGGTWSHTYRESQGILRMLVAQAIYLDTDTGAIHKAQQVKHILNAHAGQGKKGALACAVELVKAGYKDNAKW